VDAVSSLAEPKSKWMPGALNSFDLIAEMSGPAARTITGSRSDRAMKKAETVTTAAGTLTLSLWKSNRLKSSHTP
jgi:hypothetical protein